MKKKKITIEPVVGENRNCPGCCGDFERMYRLTSWPKGDENCADCLIDLLVDGGAEIIFTF